jgi:hypothetical protein
LEKDNFTSKFAKAKKIVKICTLIIEKEKEKNVKLCKVKIEKKREHKKFKI